MDNKGIDLLIKESLSNEADKITPADRFTQIQSMININKNSSERLSLRRGWGFNFRRAAAGIICGTVLFAGLSLALSEDVRAAAADTINRIKTIFVVDKVDGQYKIVEKNAKDAQEPYFAVGTSTIFSETEIEKMLGYKIHFSETIGDYKLVDRGMGLILQKKTDYETVQKLQKTMLAAINNDDEFNKLKDFKPLRDVCGAYKNNERTVYVEANNSKTWQSDLMSKSNNIEDVKLGDMSGKWVELPLPVYPMKESEGAGGFDFSQRPTEIKLMHALIWKAENINYMLTTHDKNSDTTLDNMVKIAQTFMSNLNSSKDFKSAIVYEVQADAVSGDSMNEMMNTLKSRFEALGFKDVKVMQDGEKRIKLFITGDQELDSIAAVAGNRNRLEFVSPDGTVELTEKDVKGAAVSNGALLIQFTNEGKGKLSETTAKLIDKPLSVFLDKKLLTKPIVRAPITDGRVMLTGMDSIEDMKRIATIFKSGKALEYQLKVVTIQAVQ